ncbi:MAG TPA: oligoribonuclease [Acidimicrobiales bacterium]|nr:oligoribonuclease [Acidimicrobiales bacterium]
MDGVLVWMDLEMTGLDPTTDLIVEIATLVTDGELNVLAEGPDLVIKVPDAALDAMGDVVTGMHAKSGLTDAIRASTVTLEEAGAATLDFIRAHAPEPRSAPLCGNSIGTDRRFLLRYLPEIEEHLHYRCVDVSTIKELAQRWYPELFAGRPEKSGNHRALGDILDSVAELRYYRSTVFIPTPATPATPAVTPPPVA